MEFFIIGIVAVLVIAGFILDLAIDWFGKTSVGKRKISSSPQIKIVRAGIVVVALILIGHFYMKFQQ